MAFGLAGRRAAAPPPAAPEQHYAHALDTQLLKQFFSLTPVVAGCTADFVGPDAVVVATWVVVVVGGAAAVRGRW